MDWTREYEARDALWFHDGNKLRPHALLSSGRHSNGFFDSRPIVDDEVLLSDAASDLLLLFAQQGGDISRVEGVVGPETGATKLAKMISNGVKAYNGRECLWASPSKNTSPDGVKTMLFSEDQRRIVGGRRILLCEDVLYTGGSVELTIDAVNCAGGIVLNNILILVNRGGLAEVGGKKIVALIDRLMPMWTPDECPLCKIGSIALRGKTNLMALNAID